jgi:hypothetical protein
MTMDLEKQKLNTKKEQNMDNHFCTQETVRLSRNRLGIMEF